MKDEQKIMFKTTAENNNGYIRVQIPSKIAEFINAKPGDKIAFQTEKSQQYGKYASIWNHTKQKAGEKK